MVEEFIEKDEEMIRVFRYLPEKSVFFKTARQDVAVLDTLLFGRTLFLDGILQSSEKDEEIYHRALVHPCMIDHKENVRVLILGGGEGATLREVLKWKNLGSVTMLDWDKELVEYFRKNEPSWHRGAFEDPRVTLEFSDVFEAIKQERNYDVILVDLVDPDFEDSRWKMLFSKLVDWVAPGGNLCINAGGIFPWDFQNVTNLKELLQAKSPKKAYMYKHFIPSFGREWAFVILKKS